MSNPWELYDLLIDDIADTILVTGNVSEGQWTHVATDDNSLGVAYAMSSYTDRTPDMHNDTMTGKTLVEVAQLAKSWDFSLASVGMAAINAFYCNPDRAAANGFHPVSTHESFGRLLGVTPWLVTTMFPTSTTCQPPTLPRMRGIERLRCKSTRPMKGFGS